MSTAKTPEILISLKPDACRASEIMLSDPTTVTPVSSSMQEVKTIRKRRLTNKELKK
jgi:hypothetical protein